MENRVNEILKVVVENGVVELEEVVKLVEEGISADMFNDFIGSLQFIDEEVAERISKFINDHLDEIKNGVKIEDIVKNDNDGIYDIYDVELARNLGNGKGCDKKIVITCGVGDVNIPNEVESMVVDIKNNISEEIGKEVTSTEEKSTYEDAIEKGYKGTEREFVDCIKNTAKKYQVEVEKEECIPEKKRNGYLGEDITYDILEGALTEPIEEKLTKIREDIANGEVEEVPNVIQRFIETHEQVNEMINSEFGRTLAAVLADNLEKDKVLLQQHGCSCCKGGVYYDGESADTDKKKVDDCYDCNNHCNEELDNTEMSSLDSLECNLYKYKFDPKTIIVDDEQIDVKLPGIMATERYSSEEEIEEQVNDICEKIKCDEDRTKIACIVSDIINWDYLIDGINCNIIPIGVLNVALIINVGLDVKDIKIDKSMNNINEIMVVYEDDHFIGTNEVPLYKLIGAGLAIVIPIEEMSKTLEFSPVEFRGITKLVEYSEMSKLLN